MGKIKTSAGISEQTMGTRNRVVKPPRQLLAGQYYNPILTRFLALIECSEIPAQLTDKNSKYEKKSATGYRLTSWKRVIIEISAYLQANGPFFLVF
jgi:hypothetical protein